MSSITDRKNLTFEQAEGAEPLPSQLRPKELSRELRSVLWHLVYHSLQADTGSADLGLGPRIVTGGWLNILRTWHVLRRGMMVDEFNSRFDVQVNLLKQIFLGGNYIAVFGFIQWVLRDPNCPSGFSNGINEILTYCRSPYRVFDEDTIAPIASEQEAQSLATALSDLSDQSLHGAKAHLRQAATALGDGHFADSVRESIHAVEAVARVLGASDKLSDALTKLEAMSKTHPAMRKGFTALYGWTSDEQGIRHPLLDAGDANVDEADALFMIGACASFVSYLIAKGRTAGIIAA